MNILEEVLSKYSAYATQEKELEMWHAWKASDEHPDYLRPLQNSMKNVIASRVNMYANLEGIPKSMIESEAHNHFMSALRTYDPTKSALKSHVTNGLKRVDRFVKTYQNAGRIQERRSQSWGDYLKAKTLLKEELGRDPNSIELAERLSLELNRAITPKEAERFMKEDRRDLVESGIMGDTFVTLPTSSRLLLKVLPEELSAEENAVFERLFALNGQRQMKAGEIAIELRMHPSKVSRLRNSIETKMKEYL